MRPSVAVVLLGTLMMAVASAQSTFSATTLKCTGAAKCGLEDKAMGSMKAKGKNPCPTGTKAYSKDATLCEPVCAAGSTPVYTAGRSKTTAPSVTCKQVSCPAGFVDCSGFCLQPALAKLNSNTTALCAAFAKTESAKGGCAAISSSLSCSAGLPVCLSPAEVSCPSGLVMSSDNSTCTKCPAGTTFNSSAGATCAPPCKDGLMVNGTCVEKCAAGAKLVSGKCLANCLAGETEVDGATCKTKAGKSYKKAAKSTPKVLAALAKPLEQRPPTKGKPTGLCPKGMSHCGAGKCAVNMLDADGCLLFSSMTASVNC